jgi:phosphoglycerol transferase
MESSALMSVATLLLFVGLLSAYLGRRSKPVAVSVATLVLVFILLASMFWVADWFTGHGIDQAVLYHLEYGLAGAGFSEYSRIILGVGASLLFALAAALTCTFTLIRTRPPKRPLPTSRASVPLALLACAFNPASKDLYQLADANGALPIFSEGDGSAQASFKASYRVPKLGANPDRRRNFVFIYAEGLERTYFDQNLFPGLITALRELEKISTTFTNISQTTGTSFTIGGLVGSQCGIPLLTSSGGNSMAGMSKFLPNAVCIGDLLSARGYDLSYLGGAALSFAGKGKFLSGHGFRDVRGREQLIGKLTDPSYLSGWGLHDDSLLDIAYERFIELSSKDQHFGLFMLTLDTHHPNGHISKSVADIKYGSGDVPILDAVARADRLLTDFIRRVHDSPEGKETVIILCSDHLALKNGASEWLAQGERRNLFMIIDPLETNPVVIDKRGTTLDIGPTVLHALGYRPSLGLGRDLLGEEISLSETLPDFKASLAAWKEPLSGFWGFSRLEDIEIRAAEKTIAAGGTTILAPALITFDDELEAEVFFEFNTRQTTLPDYVYGLPMGKPFVWIVDCDRASGYVAIEDVESSTELCAIAGRRGAAPVVSQRTGASLEIDEDQLTRVLQSRARSETHEEQTSRLALSLLPSGLVALIDSLPEGSVFFHSAGDRTSKYIETYAARAEVASRGIVWTTSLPRQGKFYFAAPSLKAVRKGRTHRSRRLALGDDLVTLLERYARDVVILSLRGDMKALSAGTLEALSRIGIHLNEPARSSSFAAVLAANEPIAVAVDAKAPLVLASEALQERGIDRVESAGRKLGDYSRIIVRGQDVSPNRRGLNLVVLKKDGTRTALNIDTHETERLRSDVYEASPNR